VEIEVEFDDAAKGKGILAGTSADVEVILDSREDTLRIPSSSVAEGGKVLVVMDGTLVEVVIEVGLENWQAAEVLSGLEEGDVVVTSRHNTDIKPGARVVLE
jgi:HlyD family secretion protein